MAEPSPLRRRTIEDMTVPNLSPATQRSYVHAASKFSRFSAARPINSVWKMCSRRPDARGPQAPARSEPVGGHCQGKIR